MATRKCRNMYFPKYFMTVRKFPNMYHIIPKYFRSSVNINGIGSLHVYIISRLLHMSCVTTTLKKNYGPTERGIVT